MFKKFKDKLAEEMKQSPARLQASVQQFAQAVVSPALSSSSIQEVSASNDNFSLTEDGDETPKNTPAKHNFQNIDLMSPSSNNVDVLRRSSVSSITSDVSSLFPMYESPPNLYHLQSDMDQSASEVDDNISPQLDRVTKDQLYSAYRKVQTKYHKYRNRYTDLAAHYRELDRVKARLESVLVETQDKVLRRIADLKEQCQLEQQAKAHLEEALRNDIEEKDHIINTLNTKVKLLQANGSTLENSVLDNTDQEENSKVQLIDLTSEPSSNESSTLLTEHTQLKDKLKKLESLVLRYKESLKRNKEKFTEVMKEKNVLENEHEVLKNSTAERISVMKDELNATRNEIENLTEQVEILHKREEESAISLAENKLSVHRELEEKEEQIKQLRIDLKHATEDNDNLNEIIVKCKSDLSKLQLLHADSSLVMDQDIIMHNMKGKNEMVKFMQKETKHFEKMDHIEKPSARLEECKDTPKEMTIQLKENEIDFQQLQHKLNELEKQNIEYRHDRETLQAELTSYKLKYSELKNEYDAQKIITEEKRKDANATIEKLQATVQSVDKELENMRDALIDRDQVCENYNKKVQQYITMLEKAKQELTERETQIKHFKEKLEDKSEISKMQEELDNKQTELNEVQNELEFYKSTIDDLNNKILADSSALSLLKKERSDLINRLVYYKDCIRRLKEDYIDIKNVVKEEFSNQKAEISVLNAALTIPFTKLAEENMSLHFQINELHSKITNSEQSIFKKIEMQSELDKITNLKSTLEMELEESNKKLKEMILKNSRNDEINMTNNKLIAEIDNLNFKIHDLEKSSCKLTEAQQEIELLQERIKALEKLEHVNRTLLVEIDNLKKDLQQSNHTSEEVSELNAKLREATNVINLLNLQSSNQNALQEELQLLKTEITRLKDNVTKKEKEIKIRNEKIIEQEQHIAHLMSTCNSHIQTIEEHVKKYLNLEEEYQAKREDYTKQNTELMENNKALQETINVKLVQLKKVKIINERQSKTIKDVNVDFNELKTKHIELSNMLEVAEKQIESLKLENSQFMTVTLENKDLKDKHNNLLSHYRKLSENEESLKQKVGNYEKDIGELQRNIEMYKSQINNKNEEMEHLNNQLTSINTQFECKNAEVDSLNYKLLMNEKELQKIKAKLDEQYIELQNAVSKLNTATTAGNVMKEENERLIMQLKSLRDEIERIKGIENKNAELQSQLDDFIQKNSDVDAICSENNKLIAEQISLQERIVEMENVKSHNTQLQAHVNNLQSEMSNMEILRTQNDRLQLEVDTLQSAKDSMKELNVFKDSLIEKEAELKLLKDANSNMLQEIENLKHFSLEIDAKTKEADTLKNSIVLLEEKVVNLQSQIDSLLHTNDELRKELKTLRNNEDTGYQLDDNTLREENKRLEAQLDETLITFQAKETQMQLVNNELKAQAKELREQLKTDEEEQGMRLKQLVKEFQAQLHDKEEELQAALEKRFDRQHNYESDLVQQYKEQLKDFQIELTEKSEQIESLVLEKKDAIAEKGKDIDLLVETIAHIKKDHVEDIKEAEKKWKALMQQRIDNLQAKHEEELNELTKEWQNERKPDVENEAVSKELESTSRVAMAAIQTNTGSIHTLQQTLTSQRREIIELRKLVKLRHDTLEDSTEIEYLRNILFEYMMGRETMVLARVIAAVVKFDQEQTTKILKKEEDKMTLFGSLGLV